MSLILEALRKSERERHGNPDPIVPLVVAPAKRGSNWRDNFLPKLAILLLLASAVAVAIYLFLPDMEDEMVLDQQPAASSDVVPEKKREVAAPVAVDPVPPAVPEMVLEADKQPISQPEKTVSRERQTVADPQRESARENQTAGQLPQSSVVVPPVRPAPMPVRPAAAPVKPAPTTVEKPVERQLKRLSQMPADFRRSVAPLHLDVLVYDDDSASRYVFINRREYIEGSSIKPGLEVVGITETGVLLKYRGEEFLLTVDD